MRLITDHMFRGETKCLFPGCEGIERDHSESADGRPPAAPHWFIGFRLCLGCGIGFDHPSHCPSPSWARMLIGRQPKGRKERRDQQGSGFRKSPSSP